MSLYGISEHYLHPEIKRMCPWSCYGFFPRSKKRYWRLSWKILLAKENLNGTSILIPCFPVLVFIPKQVYLPEKQRWLGYHSKFVSLTMFLHGSDVKSVVK